RGALVSALNLIGFGKLDAALKLARRGVEDSRAAFDVQALRRFSYLVALCGLLRGSYGEIETIAEEVFGLGDAPESPQLDQLTQLAMLSISATVAHRQGKVKLARRYAAQLARIDVPDGPLPGMVRQLPDIQAHAAARRPGEAADSAQGIADDHWQRGFRYSAAFGYALAVEFDPSPARCAAVAERLSAVEGEYFQVQLAYLKALAEEDGEALAAVADRLSASGRVGQALAALSRASELFALGRKGKVAMQIQDRSRALAAANPPGSYDVDRYGGRAVRLTSREREIVSLIARGMSNSDIATRLTLSLRTVESHINHIIAKSGITAREEFKGLATRLGDY
ncbi:MAG: LuxR C-terminal-related transcriptional regulator, partial [Frankiaceae bacterium]|nr:LuxR C-terminal-related transcriptional regulator [Frankiaceae bacterium]